MAVCGPTGAIIALVAAGVTTLARKAAELGDPRTERKIENMLSWAEYHP